MTLQAEQAALEKQIAASQRASESEARLQEQSQVCACEPLVFASETVWPVLLCIANAAGSSQSGAALRL